MARNTNVAVPAGTMTQLTASDVTAITFQNLTGGELRVMGTNGTTPPANTDGGVLYGFEEGERNVALSDLFPGVSGANRVWAYMPSGGTVMVSHA